MSKVKIEVTKMETSGNIKIILPNGERIRINFNDNHDYIEVNGERSLAIMPYMSNEVKIALNL